MNEPLVSVICLCYNQARFVTEAIESVLKQTYGNIQIIVIDDGSTDASVAEINKIAASNTAIEFIPLQTNQGNCKAFNVGLASARGAYIIDFATDDIMLPHRIKSQVDFFQTLDPSYGVVYSDAVYVDENGEFLYNHVENLRQKKLLTDVPQGDIYAKVISRYFISSPTQMIRKEVFDALHGYDETLAYEDYDFWIRSSREFKYAYQDEQLTKVRKVAKSMSTGWYKPGDAQLHSTYLVCIKVMQLNRNELEKTSLISRVRYELRQSVFSSNKKEAALFYQLLNEITHPTMIDKFVFFLRLIPLPFSFLRKMLQALVN